MQEVNITQRSDVSPDAQDLHIVLQRLIDEKQRAKLLEQKLYQLQQANSPESEHQQLTAPVIASIPQQEIDNRDKQIALLKKLVESLTSKVDELQKQERPREIEKRDSSGEEDGKTKIRQELHQTQNELRDSREKIFTLEEEIKRLRGFRLKLQQELKEALLVSQKVESLQQELLQNKNHSDRLEVVTRELEEQLSQQKNVYEEQLTTKQVEICALQDQLNKKKDSSTSTPHLEMVVEDQKLIIRELTRVTKELEKKAHQLRTENAQLTKDKDVYNSQMSELLCEEKEKLIREKQELQVLLEGAEQTLRKERAQCQEYELSMHELKKAVLEKETEHVLFRKQTELEVNELRSMQSRYLILEEEKKTREKDLIESAERVSLLEQHLARRVKECAMLSTAREEVVEEITRVRDVHTQETVALQKQLSVFQDNERAYKEKEERFLGAIEDQEKKIASYMQEKQTLQVALDRITKEVQHLREVEERFSQIVQLLRQCGRIVSNQQMVHVPVVAPSESQISIPSFQQQSLFQSAEKKEKQTVHKQDFFE